MKNYSLILEMVAVLLNSIGYFLYFMQIRSGKSNPNFTSWSIWAFLCILNFFSFREISQNFILSLQFFSDAIGCIFIFSYTLMLKKFDHPKNKEIVTLFLGIISIFFWWQFKSAEFANLIICFAFIISFLPTTEGINKNPLIEYPTSWYFCGSSYLLTMINIIILKDEKIERELVPNFVLFILHIWVAIRSKKA